MADYSKYYTPIKISELLLENMKIDSPSRIIDICCGSCNLLKTAKNRWDDSLIIGVDIIPHVESGIQVYCEDGRKFASESKDLYNLVLANPPFEKMKKESVYKNIYSGIFKDYSTLRLENEMLIANLMLLDHEGTLLIIMPSTFIEGRTNRGIRRIIGTNYAVKKIFHLPIETFGYSRINSYAIFLKNSSNYNNRTFFYTVVNDKDRYKLMNQKIITQKNIRSGDWLNEPNTRISDNIEIKRGAISSDLFTKKGIEVLHTCKKVENWKPSTRYIDKSPIRGVYAEKDDIIISRVGRSAGCWTKYCGTKKLISDCLIVVKDTENKVFDKIKNEELFHLKKGLVTEYIAIKDFKNWYGSL